MEIVLQVKELWRFVLGKLTWALTQKIVFVMMAPQVRLIFFLNMKKIYLHFLFIPVQLFNFQKSYSSNLSSSKTLLNASHLAHSSHIKQQVVQIIKVGTVWITISNTNRLYEYIAVWMLVTFLLDASECTKPWQRGPASTGARRRCVNAVCIRPAA